MTPAERKERSEKMLAKKGIGINPHLPMTESADETELRSLGAPHTSIFISN